MSTYISLFEHWNKSLKKTNGVDRVLKKIKKEIIDHPIIGDSTLAIQDYRDMGIRFMSNSIYDICGYHPEHFYAGGIQLGLNLIHPEDLSEVLVLQKKAFDFIQRTPPKNRHSIVIRYYSRIKNRVDNDYRYIRCVVKPLIFDEEMSIVLDLADWSPALPVQHNNSFIWSLSYKDENGNEQIEGSNIEKKNDALTEAEKRILFFLLKGQTSAEIGKKLFISKHTVDTHRRKILKKYKCKNTVELIARFKQ